MLVLSVREIGAMISLGQYSPNFPPEGKANGVCDGCAVYDGHIQSRK
jgi:hypothetical protein